jgi:hypothetical protein
MSGKWSVVPEVPCLHKRSAGATNNFGTYPEASDFRAAGAADAQAALAITVGSHTATVAGNTSAKSGSNSSAWRSHSDPHSDGGTGFFSFSRAAPQLPRTSLVIPACRAPIASRIGASANA